MINPTDKGIRNDVAGYGHFGASRGSRKHKGVDFLCDVGQDVVSPIDGRVSKIGLPYADSHYRYIEITNDFMVVRVFYVGPVIYTNKDVTAGEKIGFAQDVSERYPNQGMKPHVHLEITRIDPFLFVGKL